MLQRLWCCWFLLLGWVSAAEPIHIVTQKNASGTVRHAAQELLTLLPKAYPNDPFKISTSIPAHGKFILLGVYGSHDLFKAHIHKSELRSAGSYVVRNGQEGQLQFGMVCGERPRAVLDGIYALLEEMGYGFYMEHTTFENAPLERFSFMPWDLWDAPLVQERFLFNWHNFLSGCTGWNLEHYQKWILQGSRMGYTSIKLHFYGNNPAFQFSHNGETKEVGFMASTHRGPEWGTQLVNDVRRLPGGEIFEGPVFAADAAMVRDEQRVEAAVGLLQRVMAYADGIGMKIHLGIDMDHFSCNPYHIVETLPMSARFKDGRLVRPDTAEGHAYYKAQFEQLLSLYPQLDSVIVWSRGLSTEWMEMEDEHLPESWQRELESIKGEHPDISVEHLRFKKDKGAEHFAFSKLTSSFLKIREELGRSDLEIGYGSWWPRTGPNLWRFHHVVQDPRVSLWVKDYSRNFGRDKKAQRIYKDIAQTRTIYPIDWAQHDDGKYVGRPYRPIENFASLVQECGVQGFGIVHWMTWPLDLHPKNTIRQIWKSSRDESLAVTCRRMGSDFFGSAYADEMGRYFENWMNTAPQIGRETTMRYVGHRRDRKNHDHSAHKYLASNDKRLQQLEGVNRSKMSERAEQFFQYFLLNEKFISGYCETSMILDQLRAMVDRGELALAQKHFPLSRHRETVQVFADAAKTVGPSRGEAGHLTNLANTWLDSFDEIGAKLGFQPIGVNLGPIPMDNMALGVEMNKYYMDRQGWRWRVEDLFPHHERDENNVVDPASIDRPRAMVREDLLPECETTWDEVACSYLEDDDLFMIPVQSFTENLAKGRYRLRLMFPSYLADGKGERVVRVTLKDQNTVLKILEVDLFEPHALAKTVALGNLSLSGPELQVSVQGVKGQAVMSGVELWLVALEP